VALNLAVVGAGWAGLAAAVRAVQAGHRVTVFESARHVGGRARSLDSSAQSLDNGQHILIGAYGRTLALMHSVGVQAERVLQRQPLRLIFADGRHFSLPQGPQALAFVRGVLACTAWTAAERWSLLRWAAGVALRGFSCPPDMHVDELCAPLPAAVRSMLIDPLCVAALNTPATEASAQVLLRVLKDALLGGRGSADLLLPRAGLDRLLPGPALDWLRSNGATVWLGTSVQQVQANDDACQVDGKPFDGVVLACSASGAARLATGLNAAWAATAAALTYEPIVTVVLACPGAQLPSAMTALVEGPEAPAQFVFDHGALGWVPGRFAFVISGAAAWVEKGLTVTAQAVLQQAMDAFTADTWPSTPTVLKTVAEKRATFRCVPGLRRPGAHVHHRIAAAGDYIAGPYPATLEGAVRSGEAAIQLLAHNIPGRP
jgi:squalene-associated FAD-dependent desaturase